MTHPMNTFPNRWSIQKFESVIRSTQLGLVRGSSEIKDDHPYAYVRMDAITGDGSLSLDPIKRINATAEEVRDFSLVENDFLFNTRNSRNLVGKTALFRSPGTYLFNNNIMRLRFTEAVDPRFISYLFYTPGIQKQLDTIKAGTTSVFAIYYKNLREVMIPLPPLSEQKRIADILDKADAIRRKRREAVTNADQLVASIFLDSFGDPVSNSRAWPLVPLVSFGTVTTGNTPPREDSDNYGNVLEWAKSDNINTPYHYLTRATEGLSEKGLSVARTATRGSTLITCIAGSRECVGNAAITNRLVAFNQQINAITPKKSVDPYFLYALILLSKPLIQQASTDSMKGMVSKGKLERVELISVPPSDQLKYGSTFQHIMLTLDRHNRGLKASNDLFNSLVQRAFRGEL
jgi:type I restriction enzyme S subunit